MRCGDGSSVGAFLELHLFFFRQQCVARSASASSLHRRFVALSSLLTQKRFVWTRPVDALRSTSVMQRPPVSTEHVFDSLHSVQTQTRPKGNTKRFLSHREDAFFYLLLQTLTACDGYVAEEKQRAAVHVLHARFSRND